MVKDSGLFCGTQCSLFCVCVWCIVGLDKIEFLQNHENHEIYQKAFDIIEQYFGSEEEEDRNIAPSAGDQQFNFAADVPDAVQSSGFQFWRPARHSLPTIIVTSMTDLRSSHRLSVAWPLVSCSVQNIS